MLASRRECGDFFKAHVLFGSPPMVMVSDPKALQYAFGRDVNREFSAPGEVNEILVPLLGRQNVLMVSGEQHRNRRKLVMPPFHGERLKAYGELIREIARTAVAQWPTTQSADTRLIMQKIAMRVILQVVFGLYEGERLERLEYLLAQRLNVTDTPLASALLFFPALQQDYGPWSPGRRIRQLVEEIDALLFTEIRERRASRDGDRVDILSLLIAARDEDGNGLSDRDLHDELMTLLVAGHETTATALTWALYHLHALPDVKAKLLAELDRVADPGDPMQLVQLPYLTAVCNETLRIHPVATIAFPRRVEVPLELGGYHFEPGTMLIGSIYLVHQREDLYPEPEKFRPERFLERQFGPTEFMPFGGGARRCVGAALAMYEMKIVLGTILQQAEFSLANSQPVRPARRGFTLGQGDPVRLQKTRMRSLAPTAVGV